MALLEQADGRGRGAGATLSAAALIAILGACFAREPERAEPPGPVFSHRLHAEEGLECATCHRGVEDSDEPGMPPLRGCMLCHADLDEEKPADRRADALFAEDGSLGPRISTLDDEVIFSHQRHVASGLDCSACHGDLEQSEALGFDVAVPMAECVDCHEAEPALDQGCATCHSRVDVDWAPRTHAHAWERLHGGVARAGLGGPRNDCSLCHTESACTACHREVPPDDHTNYFRRRGHTFLAAMDRESCATCHQSDFCDRCHSEVEPISHTGAFGGTLSTHCLGCHFPLSAEEGCGVCHKAMPSHALATPKPPDHVPGMNCLQCHGVQQPLPHAHKGDDCNMCHK